MRPRASSFHVGLRWCALAWVCALGMVTFTQQAHAQARSPKELLELVSQGDQAALRRSLEEDPPPAPGLFYSVRSRAFYEPRMSLAAVLGDNQLKLKLARAYLAAVPDWVWAQHRMRTALQDIGDLDGAIEMGEQMRKARHMLHAHEQVFLESRMALVFIDAGRYAQARETLAALKELEAKRQYASLGPRDQYWATRSSGHYYQAHCELALRTVRVEEALRDCARAVELRMTARGLVNQISNTEYVAGESRLAQGVALLSQIDMARAHALAGQHYSASRIFEGLATTTAEQVTGIHWGRGNLVQIFYQYANILLLQNQLARAASYAQTATQEALLAEAGFPGGETLRAYDTKLRIDLAAQAWDVMAADLAAVDKLTEGNAFLQARTRYPVPRALLAHRQGQHGQALALMDAQVSTLRASLGEQHSEWALVLGLRGVVNPDTVAAGRDLAQAVALMVQPDLAGAEVADQGERRVLRRMVLEKFIATLRSDSPASALSLGFAAADLLRTNAVQKSIQAAALRHSFSDPALTQAVRQLQDAESSLQTLVDRLNSLPASGAGNEAQLQQLTAQIYAAQKVRGESQAAMGQQYARFTRLTRPAPASLQEVQRRLRAGEVMIALYPLASGTAVWRISADGGLQFHMADLHAEAIDRSVAQLRRTLDVADRGSRMPAFDSATSQQLYAQLVAPVLTAQDHATPRHLVFSLSGSLTQLPMAVLRPGDGPQPWLIQRHAVSQITSASSWMVLRDVDHQRRGNEVLLAWGDPLFAGTAAAAPSAAPVRAALPGRGSDALRVGAGFRYEQIPPLPETRDELVSIAQTLGANLNRDLLLGQAADRESVLAANRSGALGRRRVLAFATHGLIPGDLPDLSQPALAMARHQAHGDDPLAPLLTLSDILGLSVNADWVVLSACNTASSDGSSEEAISGLARGFFYAGARSVLATYWAVESHSAVLLTTETFRHHVSQPGTSRAESLRQAMLKVMATPALAHPAYWAPYALLGDGGGGP